MSRALKITTLKNDTILASNKSSIVFENHQKCLIWTFSLFLTCMVTLFDRKLQKVNVARFARNVVKWDFFCNFQTP